MQTSVPQYLAARPGGGLLCLRLPSASQFRSLCLTLSLIHRQLPSGVAYGVETWHDGMQRHLFVAWCDDASRPMLMHAMRMYGDVIDWAGRLELTGPWETIYGVPRIVDTERADAAESAVTIPAWLKRLQLEVA